MRHIHEMLKHLLESKAFITTGSLSGFTMGAFLFGGGQHIEIVEFFIKLIATALTGFFGGCAGELGKHLANKIKNRTNVKRKGTGDKRSDRAA